MVKCNPNVIFPVLYGPFFLDPTPSSKLESDVVRSKDGTFFGGVRMMSDIIWGKCAPKYQKGAIIYIFKPKCQNLKIAIYMRNSTLFQSKTR